ncbi:MAG: DeoR family transcriptional regulator, partial [Bacteroidota bacterium]
GEEVTQMLDGLRADLSFLGTRSLDHEKGITEIDREETRIKRAIIAASQAMVSLVIAEKLGTEQPYKIGETSQISTLVTSLDPQDKRLAPFRSLGIEVL